jgi:hypothetical protein
MNDWSHLPNARHIDWIIASLKANPEKWRDAYNSDEAWNTARFTAWIAASDTTSGTSRAVEWDSAWNAAWHELCDAVWVDARSAAYGSIAALIAYDDCSKYLTMTPDELRIWGALTEDPACVLLLPMVAVMNETQALA